MPISDCSPSYADPRPAPADHLRVSADHHVVTPFEEARRRAYDIVVVGGGGTAAVFLTGLLRLRPEARVLVLEQGPFLLPPTPRISAWPSSR